MLLLDTTSSLVQVINDASGALDVHASLLDRNESTDVFTADAQNALITTATTTTVVSSPSANVKRNVKLISVRNSHASVANTVTVKHTDGSTAVELFKATLAAGESMGMNDAGVWFVYDATGAVKAAGAITIATQTQMEAATDATVVVSAGRQQYHPGSAKFWVIAGTTGNILASYNVTSLTDTGTGVMAITIATDFSSANYAVQVSVEATATTWAVANCRECHVRNATLAAGSVSVDCVDNTATTSLVKDPTTWHVCGHGDQ
jgi:hypothetical protein